MKQLKIVINKIIESHYQTHCNYTLTQNTAMLYISVQKAIQRSLKKK